ncbi:hypothetical protein [Cereibacter johrii]|uniref:hypothetical protein n=1 Tax=Cereibacter johrii TaxID=445629 RepID=UPI003CEB7224
MLTTVTLTDGSVLDLAAWPLPEGMEDGTLNRAQLARAFSVSENTITKWISQGMPVMSDGQNGVAYEFRLRHCYAWRMERDARARAAKAQGDRLAAQAALAFRNLDEDQAEEEAELTADDLKKWSEAEYHRNRVAEQRGDLVRAGRMRELLEELMVSFGNALDTLPDFCELNFSLSAEQVAKLQERCDAARIDARARIEAALLRPGEVVAMGAQKALDL